MAITSPEAFLNALDKSALLTDDQLARARDALLLAGNAEEMSHLLIDQGLLTEWQAAQLLAGPARFQVGNYVLLDLLGRGGMGSVFLARHKKMDRQVAMKIVSRRVGKDPASLERFLTEARATAALDHPNIVRAYDVDQDKERFFIIMEYVPGQDLEKLVDIEGPLDFEFAADCVRQAAEGLAHAHHRNMVHCDIKPSNLLVTDDGVVKILDMGMARLLNQSETDSSVGRDQRELGTVNYMAPEQGMNGPDFDHRADLYSLGCTMYHLLAGHPPYDQGTLAQRIMQHQMQPVPDLREEHTDTPDELAYICQKMMAKDPADRYQSAEEIVEALAAWHPPEPVEELPEAIAKPMSTGVAIDEEDFKPAVESAEDSDEPKSIFADERRLIFWMATVAILLFGVLALVAMLWPSGRDEISKEPAANATLQTKTAEPKIPLKTPRERPANTASKRKASPSKPTFQSPNLKKTSPKRAKQKPARSKPVPTILQSKRKAKKPSDQRRKAIMPFRGFPRRVSLPRISETPSRKPAVLGKLRLSKTDRPTLRLLGGELAAEKGSHFILSRESSKTSWLIRLAGTGDAETDVARMRLEKNALTFAWLDIPQGTPAGCLKNCLLEIKVGKSRHLLALVKPRVKTPLIIRALKGEVEKSLTIDNPPQNEAMRLVIKSVEGFPISKRFRKNATIQPNERKNLVLDERAGSKVVLQVKYHVQKFSNRIEATLFYQPSDRHRLIKISPTGWNAISGHGRNLIIRENTLTNQLTRSSRITGTKRKEKEKELETVRAQIEWLKKLGESYRTTQGAARIQFHIDVAIGKRHVVLVESR